MPTSPTFFWLILAVLALSAGPAIAGVLERRAIIRASLDGFVLFMVAGLCLTALFPHAYQAIGVWALPLMALGLVLPHFAEKRVHDHRHGEPSILLWLAFAGLLLHAALDGATLGFGSPSATHAASRGQDSVALAILLHRLPVGLFVWWSVRPRWGSRGAGTVLLALGVSTTVGYAAGAGLYELASSWGGGVLHALLAGGLLHISVGHGALTHDHHAPRGVHRRAAALGSLVAIALFALLPAQDDGGFMRRGLLSSRELVVESGFAIVLGFAGAGLLSMLPTHSLAQWMTGRNRLSSAMRGMLFGIPLPVCSCGVVPLYRSLARRGVPPAAAIAFLIATPELGMDAIIISVPFLGVKLAVLRLAAAVLVALAAGMIAGQIAVPTHAHDHAHDDAPVEPSRTLRGAARYAFQESVDELGPWILAGLLLAGFLEPILSPELFAGLAAHWQVPLFALLGTPLYICASGATPLAAILLAKGVGPGAVIAFLISGPATNLTTFGAIRSVHPGRS
ncbi:MAG TPA: permease, partial [Candidatus Krumholzibacteria bacterium]